MREHLLYAMQAYLSDNGSAATTRRMSERVPPTEDTRDLG
jgi:hypothetical protein